MILLFYAVNELLSVSVETKRYESFAFANFFKRNTDPQNGHIPLEEVNEEYFSTRRLYVYDHALKFSILQLNPSLKQTETPNC